MAFFMLGSDYYEDWLAVMTRIRVERTCESKVIKSSLFEQSYSAILNCIFAFSKSVRAQKQRPRWNAAIAVFYTVSALRKAFIASW